jgi:hypothetical protein
MDLPRYRDDAGSARAAVAVKPWRRVALSVSPELESFERRVVLDRPARIGRLTGPLGTGPAGRLDNGNRVTVRMIHGGLASVSELVLLNGANRAAVLAENGIWEIVGFRAAEEVSPGHWELSGLLRGLCGTEDAMAAGASAGMPFVVLDEAVRDLRLAGSEAGLTLNWLAEAAGASGERAGPVAFAGGLRAETPIAPVHLDAQRTEDGIELRWMRRSRLDADGWDGEEVPLDEDVEAYQIEVLDGGDVVRTMGASAPEVLYANAMEMTDFGAPQAAIAFRVRQRGSKVALGIAAERLVVL